MMDLSLSSPTALKPANATSTSIREVVHIDLVVDSHDSPTTHKTIENDDLLMLNPTLRKQFAYYTTAANVTNLETMTRSSFTKFVRDCELDTTATPPLTEADLVNIFARACGTSKLMSFRQWLTASQFILQRAFPDQVNRWPQAQSSRESGYSPYSCVAPTTQCTTGEEFEALVKKFVIPKAKTIQTQNLAPDVSLSHVMKLLKEYIWQLKQIFSHFGIQSLVEVRLASWRGVGWKQVSRGAS